MTLPSVRAIAREKGLVLNGYVTMPSAASAELYAQQGWDCVTLDMEHGAIGIDVAVEITRAIRASGVVPMVRIPRGGPDLLTALGSKQVDMAIMAVQSSKPLVRQGRLKSLAVAGSVRNKVTPDVPSVGEQLSQFPNIVGFVALYAPSATPAAVMAQIHAEMNKVLVSEEYKRRLDSDGSTSSVFPTVEALKAFFDKEGQQWEALTRSAGLKVE